MIIREKPSPPTMAVIRIAVLIIVYEFISSSEPRIEESF